MSYNFKDNVRLFMIFDILGDTLRSGPLQWAVSRKRLEDVKKSCFRFSSNVSTIGVLFAK